MNTNYIRIATGFLFTIASLFSVKAQQKKDVVRQAMRDELERSMKELSYENYAKPFFIGYTINDIKSYSAFARLGGLINSVDMPYRSKNVRILVGDYEFNDESMDNSGGRGPAIENEISLPIHDDYFGIRRSLWISTDAIYKSATRQFQNNQNTVKEKKGKSINEIPHREFEQAPPVKIDTNFNYKLFDKEKLDKYAREISLIFRKYPDIIDSHVIVSAIQGKRYIENSEGTSIKTKHEFAFLQISCNSKTESGEIIYDYLNKYAQTLEQLPSLEKLKIEVDEFARNFIAFKKEKVLEEEYSGPVLFVNEAVSGLFNSTLLSYNKGLFASNTIEDLSKGIRYDNTNSLELKLGKLVLPEGFTVKCMPHLKEFAGKTLLGSFECDDEGVIPEKEMIVIKDGILKQLFHDRTSTKPDQKPNGYGSGPGVLMVNYSGGLSFEILKKKLIEKAKALNLDYAIIIKELGQRGLGLNSIYKVSLKTGEETILRSAHIDEITLKDFRKPLGTSKDLYVTNVETNGFGGPGIISFITPSAILLEEVEVKPTNSYFQKDDEYVKRPF